MHPSISSVSASPLSETAVFLNLEIYWNFYLGSFTVGNRARHLLLNTSCETGLCTVYSVYCVYMCTHCRLSCDTKMFKVISFSFTEDVIKRDCEAAELALKQSNLPVSSFQCFVYFIML